MEFILLPSSSAAYELGGKIQKFHCGHHWKLFNGWPRKNVQKNNWHANIKQDTCRISNWTTYYLALEICFCYFFTNSSNFLLYVRQEESHF